MLTAPRHDPLDRDVDRSSSRASVAASVRVSVPCRSNRPTRKPRDDGTRLELSSFVRPDSVPGSPAAMANELGLRNVAFEVNDLQAAVDWAATEGYGLVGGIGDYEGVWRWPTSGGRKGSSSRWPSASAEPRNARICRESRGCSDHVKHQPRPRRQASTGVGQSIPGRLRDKFLYESSCGSGSPERPTARPC
jgi:hypothetical protein